MELTLTERERINDTRLKLQSAANALEGIPPEKIVNYDGIQQCLAAAEESLDLTLGSGRSRSGIRNS